jgi:hypothetical protein
MGVLQHIPLNSWVIHVDCTMFVEGPRARVALDVAGDVLNKQNPAEAGLCQAQLMKRQLLVRGSLGIGGSIFSAGTFWSIGETVVDGAAGAIRGATGGLICVPP